MITRRIYFSITLMFLTVFVLFLFVNLSQERMTQGADGGGTWPDAAMGAPRLQDTFDETDRQILPIIKKERRAAVISKPGNSRDLLINWSLFNKFRYKTYEFLPPPEDLEAFEVVLFGEIDLQLKSDTLMQYAQKGVAMIFTKIPEPHVLQNDPQLMDFFGIENVQSPQAQAIGITIFADFFLSEERYYGPQDDYGTLDDFTLSVPYYRLRPGYQVYAVALTDEPGIANEDLPPLLWRTYTGNSFVFAINNELFSGDALHGVITGFLSDAFNSYWYPVINANAVTVLNFPLLSNENEAQMQARYARDAFSLNRSILWPNVVKILSTYGGGVNLFAVTELMQSPDGPSEEEAMVYFKAIHKQSGMMGLSLDGPQGVPFSELMHRQQAFWDGIEPKPRLHAVYAGAVSPQEIEAEIKKDPNGLLSDVSLIILPDDDIHGLLDITPQGILTLRAMKDGFTHSIKDDITLIALQTASGAFLQAADFSRVYHPLSDESDWMNLSRSWSSGITYYNDFKVFDDVDLPLMTNRVRRMLAMNITVTRLKHVWVANIEGFDEEAFFILRLHGEQVDKVHGGTAQKISDTAYLISAHEANITISLKPLHPPGGYGIE